MTIVNSAQYGLITNAGQMRQIDGDREIEVLNAYETRHLRSGRGVGRFAMSFAHGIQR